MKRISTIFLLILVAIVNYSCNKNEELQPEEKLAPPKRVSSVSPEQEQAYLDLLNSDPDIEFQWEVTKKVPLVDPIMYVGDSNYFIMYFDRGYAIRNDGSNIVDFKIDDRNLDATHRFLSKSAAYAEAADYFRAVGAPTDIFAAPTISESTDMTTPAGRILGQTLTRNNTEDLKYGTDGDTTGVLSYMLQKTDDDLFADMKSLIEYTSIGSLQTAGYAFLDKFRTNTSNSSTFSNDDLRDNVKKHADFEAFLVNFGDVLQRNLRSYNGDIEQVPPILLSTRLKFDGYTETLTGLKILLNDTEKQEIRLVNYHKDEKNGVSAPGWFTVHVETTVYDHFGLDKNDVLTYQGKNKGFAAWWILQHKRNKVPFITKFTMRNAIEARYR